jgi:glycine/D-amino acid oxidase-like deaminating enzyme
MAEALGVKFRFGVQHPGHRATWARITGVRTDQGLLRPTAYVLALGSYSPRC